MADVRLDAVPELLPHSVLLPLRGDNSRNYTLLRFETQQQLHHLPTDRCGEDPSTQIAYRCQAWSLSAADLDLPWHHLETTAPVVYAMEAINGNVNESW